MNHLSIPPFLHTRAMRVEWARQRFFEEGQAPTDVVGDTVFESWSRCLRMHGSPRERAAFEPVTNSRAQLALQKNRQLVEAWRDELPRLTSMLGRTSCAAMLTDATGVLIGSSCVGRAHEALMPVATRLGVNLSEDAVGTTAPGVAARTGKAVNIQGGEHFFDSVKEMYCAAAPIRDIQGLIAGVLDISSESIPFEFDAAAVVGLYAGAIENRLLLAQSSEHLVLRFQLAPDLVDSAMVGLVGIDIDGRLAWSNAVALSLLGRSRRSGFETGQDTEHSFGRSWWQLAALPSCDAVQLTLPNGLTVWARVEMQARDGLRGPRSAARTPAPGGDQQAPSVRGAEPVEPQRAVPKAADTSPEDAPATPPPDLCAEIPPLTPSLRDSNLELIRTTLQACGGNVSEAAQRLGVSRGLIYRRLRSLGQALGTATSA